MARNDCAVSAVTRVSRGSLSPGVAVYAAIKRGASVWLPSLHTEALGVFECVRVTCKSLEKN